jgi:hypothetical protein
MVCVDCPADIVTQDGALHCHECVTEDHMPCEGCGEWISFAATCKTCADCYYCDRTTPAHETTTTVEGDEVCDACLSRHCWRCDECDEWNSKGEDYCRNGCIHPGSCTCDTCIGYSPLIHDYDYQPVPVFHGAGPLFLGIEIELHTRDGLLDESAGIAIAHLGELGYLKEDDTIGVGFEVVAHPMSYDWALSHFPWTMLDQLRRNGCSTSPSTGLHVHVSRAGFASAAHTFRWMKFIYRNREHVTRIARRESAQYAAFDDNDRRAIKQYATGDHHGPRNAAINVRNVDTIELRIFASSLDASEVQAALALTAASIEYTRALSVADVAAGGWDWPAFAAWVAHHPRYQPLHDQIQALNGACRTSA